MTDNTNSVQNGTDGVREIKKGQVIKAWKQTRGNVSQTCRIAGINRKTFYQWIKNKQFRELLNDETEGLNSEIKELLIKKALSGNLRAITYYLEHKHPEFKKSSVRFVSDDPLEELINDLKFKNILDF